MKKKTVTTKQTALRKAKPGDLAPLIVEVRNFIRSARHAAASTVSALQVLTNFEIGRRIVEHEQKGQKRAEYGTQLLKELSARLTEEFGKGFSERNLRGFRLFYQTYQQRMPRIWQTPSAKSRPDRIRQTPSAELSSPLLGQKPSDQFAIAQTASGRGSTSKENGSCPSSRLRSSHRISLSN